MEWKKINYPVLGVVGGMGSYASLHFYKRFLDAFPAERDWERPRIIIDSNSQLPSRVRAILYKENEKILVDELTKSVKNLINSGATYVFLACHTSHFYLDKVKENLTDYELEHMVSLIDLAVADVKSRSIKEIYVMGSEGTILSGIYRNRLNEICNVKEPNEEDLIDIREMIESVKQNKVSSDILLKFSDFINDKNVPVILGCSELPVLFEAVYNYENDDIKNIENNRIIDPLNSIIEKIKVSLNYDCELR